MFSSLATQEPLSRLVVIAIALLMAIPNVIRGVRHLNSTIHHAFGYAYVITGDRAFLEMGDDMFGASFGDKTDALRNLATVGGKEYDMTFRSSGRYLAWRLFRP